ncbi:MAG: TRAP transporter substrate-binding protein DctP [Syntrophaceae bacterium]|nr:TRAP transporter substrate-binding protein DctP [Syntrophaceae bacterium]
MITKWKSFIVAIIFIFALSLGTSLFLSSPAIAKAKPVQLIFSTYWPTSYTYLVEPIENFAKKVEKQTNGQVKIKIYHSAQLFKGKEEFAACERGDIDMTAPLDIYMTGIIPELGVSSLPFLISDNVKFQKALDAGLWDLGIRQKLIDHNLVLLGVGTSGAYQVYSKKSPVIVPKDFEGKAWGVSGSTASKACDLLGGSPTTMSSGELYMALQRGTIDGCTRPLITGLGRKLYEVVKHLTVTNMYYFTSFLVINKKTWDKLPKEYQEFMKKAGKERDQEQLQKLLAYEKDAVKKYREKGVTVHISTPAELAKFREKIMPVYDWWYKMVPDGKKYTDFVEAHL